MATTIFWSHHPQPDWKENAYTQWLGQKEKFGTICPGRT